ncbi:IS110 family transposase [Streptosporangium subroseum]|uniref:IS110 family transposase n=1 Tax=Streptosporangium subroseum TaxID=106412 RepID=UPI001FEBBBC4|nr:IS110 family transposase [Streptosporangium subroseum]
MIAEFGDADGRYVSAKARRNYAGTSPITRASGKKKYVAALYGNHLQHVTGIAGGFSALPHRNEAERSEKERRWSLQAKCLPGVFLGSV